MFNLFPFTNFHDLNMDWIIKKVRSAVQSVNGRTPDENGNVVIPQVEGVTSVNGILPDLQGNVESLPVYSISGVLSQFNNLGDLISYARNNTKKIFQATISNFPSVHPISPADTDISDSATIEMFCVESSGETICRYWNNTKKKYYLAINTIPINNVLNPNWINIYNGDYKEYILTDVATMATDVTAYGKIIIANGIAYLGVFGDVSALKAADDLLLTLSSAVRPAFERYATAIVVGSSGFGCKIEPNGEVRLMYQGTISSGSSFVMTTSYPL